MFGYEILLVHGAWAGPWVWGSWAPYLASEGWAVRSLTLPGHAPGDEDFTHGLSDFARYVDGSLDPNAKTILIGHSMGGWLCLKAMEKQPVAASVLISPLPIEGVPSRSRNALTRMDPWGAARTLLFGQPAPVPSEEILRAMDFLPSTPEQVVKRFRRQMVPESAAAIRQMAWLRWTGPRVNRKRLAQSQSGIPHLLLASPDDFFFRPEELAATAKALGAEVALQPGLPHYMMEVDQDLSLARKVDGWLRERLACSPRGDDRFLPPTIDRKTGPGLI